MTKPQTHRNRMTTFRMLFFYIMVLIVGTLNTGCDPNRVFDENKDINADGWDYADIKTFDVEITDTNIHYNVAVNVRHSFQFEWRNVYVTIGTLFPDSQNVEKRVNLQLSEPNGEWFGRCMGDNCFISIPIQQNAIFPKKGKYTFTIKQDMRTNPLPNIKFVGLRVEKASAKQAAPEQ